MAGQPPNTTTSKQYSCAALLPADKLSAIMGKTLTLVGDLKQEGTPCAYVENTSHPDTETQVAFTYIIDPTAVQLVFQRAQADSALVPFAGMSNVYEVKSKSGNIEKEGNSVIFWLTQNHWFNVQFSVTTVEWRSKIEAIIKLVESNL